jgi:hypothetical protein
MQPNPKNQINLWREWPLYLVWLAIVVHFGFAVWPNPLIAGPLGQDDALHLVQVRDLLAGQHWFDLVQHRFQPPQGLDMHWSRLIDAPMAALSFMFGERAMLFLWPSLLIGGFLFAALYAAKRISPQIELLPVLFVSALCLVPLCYFAPTRIDHHNVQMVLALIMAGALARPLDTLKPAIIAAVACALMMAIGLETLPYVVVGLAVISISWALGFSEAKPVAFFGTAFAGLTALVWMLQTNFQTQQAVCDMLSPTYVLPIIFGGLGLDLSTRLAKNYGVAGRLVFLAMTGIVAVAVFVLVNPTCLGGPMAQVPLELQERWLKTVAEAQPVTSIWKSAPGLAVERYGPPVFALILGLFLAWRKPEYRYGLIVFLALLAAACAVTIVQLRGTLFAHAFTIAIFALAIDLARKNYTANQKSLLAIGGMAVAFLTCQSLFFLIGSSFAPGIQTSAIAKQDPAISATSVGQLTVVDSECAGQDVRDAITGLGDAFVAAPVFFGAQVLEMGNVSVMAGPYHRATGAIFDALKLFEDGALAEQDVLSRWKPDYLVLCTTSDDTADVTTKHPQSLSARLKNGQVPDWLKPLPKAGQLAIYAVLPKQ